MPACLVEKANLKSCIQKPFIVSRAVNCMNLFIKCQCLQGYEIKTHLTSIVHKTATYLSFLVRPLRWRRLCLLKILLARHHFSKKRCCGTCAHPPTVCLLCLLFTVSKVSICQGVFKLPSCSYVCIQSSEIFPFFHSLSFIKQKSCSCLLYLVHS